MADGRDGMVKTDQRNAVERLRIDADPESVEKGLVTLVLTLVELLRQLMERQALRRVEQGSLTDDQIEKVGSTLMALDARMAELRDHFGLTVEDLNLDLGPLGPLLPYELLFGFSSFTLAPLDAGRALQGAGTTDQACPA